MHKFKEIYYKITDNPLLGLIPLYVFTISDYSQTRPTALLYGFLACFFTFVFVVILGGRGRIHTALFCAVSITTITICSTLFFVPGFAEFRIKHHFYSQLLTEAIIIFSVLLIVSFRKNLQSFFINTIKANVASSFLGSLDEYLYIAKVILWIFIGHLVAAIAFVLSPLFKMEGLATAFIWAFVPIFVFILIIFEYIRLQGLRSKLDMEEWLAVVDNKGNVIGRIAKSETRKEGNKYLHPVVRVAVICRGKLYLTQRPDNLILDPGKLDHPFEKYVQYEYSLDKAAINLLHENGLKGASPYFSVKYLFENEATKRLIFLYTIEVCDDSAERLFNRQKFESGKFWTQKQIEENLETGLFCECFEKEYEYLKNTILLFSGFESSVESSN